MWPPSVPPVHPSSCRSELAEKTKVEEMGERREAVAMGETVWLTLLTLGLTEILLSTCLDVFLFN